MNYCVTNEYVQFEKRSFEYKENPNQEMKLIKIYPSIEKQKIIGFGGAFTEASAYVWSKMNKKNQELLLDLYFGERGNKYNFGRTHIQSCDFSLGNRSYIKDGDAFSIEDDKEYIIPFMKSALKINNEIEILASPWSPPAFMKTNKDMNHGGKLLKEYYGLWAELMAKYLLAYKEEGIRINRITVQNEPAAVQIWDSCIYSGEEEGIFAAQYLRKALDNVGLNNVKINVWDHNKDKIIERLESTFSIDGANKAIDGIAFHWYTGDHFEALQYISEKYSDKELIFTEGCVEYSRFLNNNQVKNAEMYAHEIIGDLKCGLNGFLDWNLLLNKDGGPNHVKNYCDSPIMYDIDNEKIDIKLSYYYIGHFSRFIQKGAKRILSASYNRDLECVAFKNPNNEIVIIIMNVSDETKKFKIMIEEKTANIELESHSIMTICN